LSPPGQFREEKGENDWEISKRLRGKRESQTLGGGGKEGKGTLRGQGDQNSGLTGERKSFS